MIFSQSYHNSVENCHYQEWLASAVDPEIIALNVESLTGREALERLTENAIALIGKDQKVPHSYQYETQPVQKILNRYRNMSDEGWWCSGVDVSTGKPSLWGCFKPDKPRTDKEKGKPIKYEHPAKTPTEIFALRIPDRTWQTIADRYRISPFCKLPVSKENSEKIQSSPLHTFPIDNSLVDHDCGVQFWEWVIS